MQKKIGKLKKKCKLTERAGPAASSLEKVLKKHKIEVVAYHSRSFVGNHANKYIKSETLEDLTETVKRVCRAHTHNKNINDYARDISEAFKQLNTFLSKVHRQVSHDNPVLDNDIKNAKKAIKKNTCISFEKSFLKSL